LLKNSVRVFLLIAIVFFTMMLIMMTSCKHSCEAHRKPEAPKNLAPTLDSVIAVDSMRLSNLLQDLDLDADMDTDSTWNEIWKIIDNVELDSTWHGKEGKSEYGQYEPSDVERMWIGNDGDTIWE